jgi:hypothetical protein
MLHNLSRAQVVSPSKMTLGDWLDEWLESAIKSHRRLRTHETVSADGISPKITELKSPLNTESQCPFTDHSDGGGTDAAKGGLYGDSGTGGTGTVSVRHCQTGGRASTDGAPGSRPRWGAQRRGPLGGAVGWIRFGRTSTGSWRKTSGMRW